MRNGVWGRVIYICLKLSNIMQLIDFFQPFTLSNITVFVLLILSMDYVGYKLSKLFHIQNDFRVIYWILGFSFFVFLWFLLHFFIPFNPNYVAISLIITILMFRLAPIKYSFTSLFKNKFEIILLLLFLFPFLKILFFHISLPPRFWDEMAYHFYSPVRLRQEITWSFESPIILNQYDFYMMLPRTIDTMYVITFALTKTYATAQLLHTLIYLSVILLILTVINKYASKSSVIIFLSFILFYNYEILFSSNSGYIDVASASISLIALISLFKLIKKPNLRNFSTAVFLSAISIGTKYTILSYLVSIWLSTLIILFITNKTLFKQLLLNLKNRRSETLIHITKLVILSIIGGGYWYIKNLLLTGNATYPFSLFCRNCSIGAEKLKGWGYLDFSIENFSNIFMPLFNGSSALVLIFILGISLIQLKKEFLLKRLTLMVVLGFIIEFLILSRVGNYTARFFYHWPMTIGLLLSLSYKFKSSFNKSLFIQSFLYISILFIIFNNFQLTKPIEKGFEKISGNDRWFARGKITIVGWIENFFPNMYETITYCGKNHKLDTYYIADPNMIWGRPGLSRMFLVNCNYNFILLDENANKTFTNLPKNLEVLSTQGCLSDEENSRLIFKNKEREEFHKLNQMLVCERNEVRKYIYK